MRPEELERELRAERPEVEPGYARRLDEWAARGFPRGGELDPRREEHRRRVPVPGRLRRAWRRVRAAPPRRVAAPVAAAATLLIVVGGVLVSRAEQETTPVLDGGTPDAGGVAESGRAAPDEATPGTGPAGGEALQRARPGAGAGALGRGPGRRRVAQTVSVSLATSVEDFRGSADGVLDVVRDHDGIVVRSSVSGGDPEVEGSELGRASFRLRIPATQLQAALGALSDLGHLVSRTDGSRDITARFESAQDRIEAFADSRDRLLRRLETATAEAEEEALRRRLRIVESRLERARDDLARAQQRVRLVPVTVTVAADESIRDRDGWGIGDALDDAAAILRTALAVALVTAAVLLPVALLALIALLGSRLLARRRRERALDGP